MQVEAKTVTAKVVTVTLTEQEAETLLRIVTHVCWTAVPLAEQLYNEFEAQGIKQDFNLRAGDENGDDSFLTFH